ncbi:hypothetical protein KP509_12G090800 [Ceratopteris richardii]|uniref:Phosphate acetyltransferase n=1 Tax=Ceratopteris richardii TaxID=49495 RepID=A0A8T2TNT2_CERRI|nr:hypothetical protein KP509_12G090800 [Ceratopteris richardii]
MLRLLQRRRAVRRLSTFWHCGSPSTGILCGIILSETPLRAQKEHHIGARHAHTASRIFLGGLGVQRLSALENQPLRWAYQTQHRRYAHAEGIYVHHTTGHTGHCSLSVTIGLFHALRDTHPNLGFFTPIEDAPPPNSPSRFQIMKQIFNLEDKDTSMHGVTHVRAFELIEHNNMDELLEEVLKAYEACKAKHDFVVVEGASLKRAGDDSTVLNAKVASTLGLPVLMVTDAVESAGVGKKKIVRWDRLEWESDIALTCQLTASVMKRNFVDVLGSVIYQLPDTKRGQTLLKKYFEELDIPYLGAIPDDSILKCIKVDDIISVLGADILYGTHGAIANAKESSIFITGIPQLSDFLEYAKGLKDAGKSIVVVTDASRPDILLGLIALNQSDTYPSLSAVVVAGRSMLSPEVEILIKEQRAEELPPIIYCQGSCFETAATLAQLEGQLLPDSVEKIEHSKVLFEKHVDKDLLLTLLTQERVIPIHPKVFQHRIFVKARSSMQHIVLPEGDEPRTVRAASILLRNGVCKLTMLGDVKKIEDLARELQVDLAGAQLVDPSDSEYLSKYSKYLYEARKHKGMSHDEAQKKVSSDVNYFGTCMVACGDADGMVSGAVHTTADTVRPALQLIKTEPGLKIASSVFLMCLQGKVLVFGDCAINTNPTTEELAQIAIASANTAVAFGIQPRVALLSYATDNSNSGPLVDKIADAVALVRERKPDLIVEGPLQYDAAVNAEIAKIKLKGKATPVAGRANVLIFPDLNTGNITYKAVQQSTDALAMGPIIQGLNKPINDLSRGCTVHDIVSTVAITAVQAAAVKQKKISGKSAMMAGA